MQDQEGGPAITMPWQMEVLGNFGTCSLMEIRMKKKETFPCVSTQCIEHEALGNFGIQR
jgi:hypothetical protein